MVIAVSTKPGGMFMAGQWGTNGTDMEIRQLIHGLSTMEWSGQRTCQFNPAVIAETAVTDGDDGKTYQLTLKEGLRWSDGSPLTARDYVFSLLLQASEALASLGAAPSYDYVAGYQAYRQGQPFSGVRLLGDLSFSITVSSGHLPYFYENAYLMITPLPISLIAPGNQISDDGEGACFVEALTADVLENTLLDPDTGYMTRPSLCSGPYLLREYNPQTGETLLEANSNYPGNSRGVKPMIPSVRVLVKSGEAAYKALQAGEVDVISRMVDGALIDRALKKNPANTVLYPRKGYGFLGFDLNDAVTGSLSVRQAISHCLRVRPFAEALTKGYGAPVYGEYGFGHWAAIAMAKADAPLGFPAPQGKAFAAFSALPFEQLRFSYGDAKKLLFDEGWRLTQGGSAYTGSGVRYKQTEQGLVPLEVRFLKPDHSAAAQLAERLILPALRNIGFRVNVIPVPSDQALSEYRRPTGLGSLFILSSDFADGYDPLTNPCLTPAFDETLYKLAHAMRQTSPENTGEYLALWEQYQTRYAQVLPTLPLYSNVYADVFSPSLANYHPERLGGWAAAIIESHR